MTREEMRNRVVFHYEQNRGAYPDLLDAAIAIIRGEVLEEAARECERMEKVFAPQQIITDRCAAAIRALKDQATT